MDHQKKRVLITGVGRAEGIGFGLAQAMHQRGYEVIISARNQEKAEARAKEISTEASPRVEALDITDEKSVADLAQSLGDRFGRLDILINNAGAPLDFGMHPLETDFQVTKDTLDINLFGTWRVIRHFYPLLKASTAPRIVNISSGAGSFGDPVFGLGVHPAVVTSYGLSKLALNGLTVKMARQFKADGILINAVCPGFVATAPGMREMGARPVSEALEGIIWAAELPEDGPNGGFFRDKLPLSW
ncbi:MAG: SDR family NAD(P)-dependent oxidoreductase [Bacteroidota bacterium]